MFNVCLVFKKNIPLFFYRDPFFYYYMEIQIITILTWFIYCVVCQNQ